MSAEHYAKHLEVVKKGFHRRGVDISSAREVELESLGVLENILRVSSPEGQVLSDMPNGAYSADFYDAMRKLFFRDYLDYRKTYLELSLDEYVGERFGLPEADKSVDENFVAPVYSGVEGDDEELLPEDLIERLSGSGLVLFTIPNGVDSDGYDIWVDPERDMLELQARENEDKFRSLEFGDFSIGEILNPVVEVTGVKGSLSYDPFGVDSDGYDIWEDSLEGESDESSEDTEEFEADSDEEEIDLGEGISFVEEVEEAASDEPKLYGTHEGIDSSGYDIWAVEAIEAVVEPVALVEEPEEQVLAGNWQGIDERGYDIWTSDVVVEDPNTFDTEEHSDGFDHSNDPERDSLGELHSKWVGEDSKGYDLWESGDGVEPSIADVSTPEEELKSPHYGVDSSGFDIWVSPVAESTTSNGGSSGAVSSTSASANTSTIPMNEVTYTNASGGEPIVSQAPLSREDQLLSSVDHAISGLFQFGKRITGSNSRRNTARNR